MVMGDFDGDGIPDVAILDVNSGKVEVKFGDGSGGFRAGTATFTITDEDLVFGFAAADMDGGGQSELILTEEQSVVIYKWDGSNFTLTNTIDVNTPTGIFAFAVTVGDLTFAPNTPNAPTAGGSRDIVVTGIGAVGAVWIPNDGTGHFGTPVAVASDGSVFGNSGFGRPIAVDIDGDGLADVVILRTDLSKVGVLLNKGDGTLATEADYGNSALEAAGAWTVLDLAVADVDGDTHPDLVVTGYIHDPQTSSNTYHLSVNISNANGTFSDGKQFDFAKDAGVAIQANAIDAADFNGDGRMDIVTVINAPALNVSHTDGVTGFTITRFTGVGDSLAIESQDNFSNGGIAFNTSIALGYVKGDGTFATFDNDTLPDVLIGNSGDFNDPPPSHSEFFLFQNTTGDAPNDRSIAFATPNSDVVEGSELDVPIQRGTASTGQVLVAFTVGGTAVEAGPNVKSPDYTITIPAQGQAVTFGVGEFEKNIHLSIPTRNGAGTARTAVLTLLDPVGDAELGPDAVATVTINDTKPATLANPGGLSVKPTNVVLPKPRGAGVQAIGRTGSDWDFSVSQMLPAGARNAHVKVQTSIEPPSQNQWTDYLDLAHGKGTSWTGSNRHPPLSTQLFFRTITSADGYPDEFGNPTQPFGVLAGPELGVQISATTDSDVSGDTVHNNPSPGPEAIIYQFNVTNSSTAEIAASKAILTVPIPTHTTFLNTTGSSVPVLDKSGKTVAVKWNFSSIPVNGSTQVSLLVTVDVPAFFSSAEQKTHPNGYGYVIREKSITVDKNGFNLSAPSQGVTAANIVGFTEFDTEIIGSLKLELSDNAGSVNPGGLITYQLDCENDASQPITGYVATDKIPNHTELAAVYVFDSNGNATDTPLLNPGTFTNPAIIYAKSAVTPKVDASDFLPNFTGLTPSQALAKAAEIVKLLAPIFTAKAGAELDLSGFNNDSFKLDTLKILIDNAFIVPARIKWAMGTIPGKGGGQSNVRSVAFTVRVPYDAAALDAQGNPVLIVNNYYDFGVVDVTQTQKQKHLVFNPSALYGDAVPAINVSLNNVGEPAAEPQLLLAKSALGDQNLNNPSFHGNGFSTLPAFGNVVTVVQNHGVDYQLAYINDLDSNGQGADAHGVVLHDVIPEGMALRGFFTQNVNGTGAGPMFAGQFTFYDKSGAIIPGVDPATNADNMAKVASMDIRLGSVSNLSVVPKGTFGTVRYTCSPTISTTTQIKYTPNGEPEGFFGGPGLIHSFGGFMAGEGLSGQFQGFYITTTDKLTPVQGGPTDCIVHVVTDVSWNFQRPTLSVNDTQPFDIAPVDFTFTQNGDVSAPNTIITFSVPPGVTFLNGTVTPRSGAVVTTGSSHVADGNTSFDCRPVLTMDSNTSVITANLIGSNVTLLLNTVNGHASGGVRVYFQVNGPTLDPGLQAMVKSDGGYHPINPHIIGSYAGITANALTRALVARPAVGSQPVADAAASGTNPQKVHELSPPRLGVSRSAPFSVMKSTSSNSSQFTYSIIFTNTGDTDATQVTVGMQIPFRTDFVSTSNGEINVFSGDTFTPTSVATPYTTTPRSGKQLQPAGGSLHPGPDIVTWQIGTLPAQSTGTINLVVRCDSRFADQGIGDNSLEINADGVGKAHIAASPITTWIIGTALSDSKIQAAQMFFQNAGISVTPALAPAVSTLAESLTDQSQVHALANLDALHLLSLGVKIIPLGKNQVMVISNDGGSIVSTGGSNIVSHDGGTIVASGAGNAISINNVPAFGGNAAGTYDCATLLGNIPAIVASGAGNIVASGAGNLITQDGGGIISNLPGGGILGPIGQIAGTAIQVDGGNVVSNDGGSALAAGAPIVSHDGGTLISQDGGGLITQDGGGLTTFGSSNALNGSPTDR